MNLHADAVAVLESWPAPSGDQDTLRRHYLDHLAQHPDGMTRACAPDHLTASLLVMAPDRSQVLLTLHARAQRWFQFGGHAETEDEILEGAALREGQEESGLSSLQLVSGGPVELDLHEVRCSNPLARRHLDVRYLALASPDLAPTVSDESVDVRWWPTQSAPDDVRGLIAAAVRRLDQLGS